MRSLYELGILQGSPGKLRECVAERVDSLRLHLEPGLLRHRRIEDVISREQRFEK